jgi:putative IMPACT (imprinted ancient) family translation regulator
LNSILTAGFAEQTINKSRFIAMAVSSGSEREVGSALRAFAAKNPSAHHLAYAFRIQPEAETAAHQSSGRSPERPASIVQRFSDAGEPTGTAGMPVLKLIEGGGLARAYAGTAKLALDAAKIMPFVAMQTVELTIHYKQMDLLSRALADCNGTIVSKDFNAEIDLVLSLPADLALNFLQRFQRHTS